jgi:WD40 repeat protein
MATFSPDGQSILIPSYDNTAQVWDVSGRKLTELQGHTAPVLSAVFSPDGQRIVTTSRDNTARLWDLHGTQLAILYGHTAPVTGAVFSPDGRQVLTASDDYTSHQYLVNVEDLLKVAACRVGRGLTDEEIQRFQVPTPLKFDFAKRQCPPALER